MAMSKGNKGGKGKVQATQGGQQGQGTQGAAPAQGLQGNQHVTPQVIATVAPNRAFRGARAAWYAVLCQHQGKPVAEFYKATADKPPSLPKSGVAEKPSGWLAWFVRSGIATLSTPEGEKQA